MEVGFIYAVHDPRLKDERKKLLKKHKGDWARAILEAKDVFWVGAALHPWETLDRYVTEPPNAAFGEVIDEIYKVYDGLVIPDKTVCEVFYGTFDELPFDVLENPEPKVAYLEWDVLEEIYPSSNGDTMTMPALKSKWIKHFKDAEHPVLNRKVGRPRGRHPVKWAKVHDGQVAE